MKFIVKYEGYEEIYCIIVEVGGNDCHVDRYGTRHTLEVLHRKYPKALIVGHHDLNPQKACPCIANVAKEYAELQPK